MFIQVYTLSSARIKANVLPACADKAVDGNKETKRRESELVITSGKEKLHEEIAEEKHREVLRREMNGPRHFMPKHLLNVGGEKGNRFQLGV